MKIITEIMDEMLEFMIDFVELIFRSLLALIMMITVPIWAIPYIIIKEVRK